MRLINPIPYAATPDTPLNAKVWTHCATGKDLCAVIDADFLVYRCCFCIEHKEFYLMDEHHNAQLGPCKNVTLLRHAMDRHGYKESELPDGWSMDYSLDIEDFSHAWMRMQQVKKHIMEVIGTKKNVWYLTKGSTLWRNKDATIQGYKANRKDSKKPQAYDYLRERLVSVMKAKILNGVEADDAVAHMGRKYPGKVVIVSPDKDLLTIPGLHLNPMDTAKGVFFVSELEACRYLYGQMLSGDGIDNIRGLHGTVQNPGWSVAAAKKEVAKYYTEGAMQTAVMLAYQQRFPNGLVLEDESYLTWDEILLENANLLFLRGSHSVKFTMEK